MSDQVWSNERTSYIKMALRNNQDALEMFEEMVSSVKNNNDSDNEDYTNSPHGNLLEYALSKNDNLNLLSTDLLVNEPYFIKAACFRNFRFDLNPDITQKIYTYFGRDSMYSLTDLDLNGTIGISEIINNLFKHEKKDSFISLQNVHAERSDITSEDISTIRKYFYRNINVFVRDEREFSAIYSEGVISVCVHVANSANIENIKAKTSKTIKTSFLTPVYYRNNMKSERLPLVFHVIFD